MHRADLNTAAALLGAVLLAACRPGETPGAAGRDTVPSAPALAVGADAADAPPGVAVDGLPGFRFVLFAAANPGRVDSIGVVRDADGARVQTLAVLWNHALPAGLPRLSAIDLDFDGHADLGMVAAVGAANSSSDYWRYDPAAGRFAALGSHSTFTADSAARELRTLERGGHAGLIYEAGRWRYSGGRLVQVQAEEQEFDAGLGVYVRTVRELRGDTLVEVRRDTLTETEAVAAAQAQ